MTQIDDTAKFVEQKTVGSHAFQGFLRPCRYACLRSNIDAALARGATLAGRITAADTGQPLERALVTLYTSDGHVVNSRTTYVNGSYSFDELPSGAYRLGVEAAQTDDGIPYFVGYQPVFYGGGIALADARVFNLAAAQHATLDVAMPRGVFIPILRR